MKGLLMNLSNIEKDKFKVFMNPEKYQFHVLFKFCCYQSLENCNLSGNLEFSLKKF